MMEKKIIKASVIESKRSRFVDINEANVSCGQNIIIESSRGEQFATVESGVISVSENMIHDDIDKILRIATYEDERINERNIKNSKKALDMAKKIAKELDLKMRFLSSNFTFDRSQLILSYVSDDRVDFRELAKKLASIYKTRIELRQIGVRDKAKEIGGLGPCGRFLCCSLFLNDFESVSINMAKNQYISLKPDKINGACGRLLCCLNYEDKQYSELKIGFPKMSSKINYSGKEGKVISYDLFRRNFTIETSDKTYHEIDLSEYESSK